VKKAPTERPDPLKVTKADVKTADDLVKWMKVCFDWEEKRVWSEANYLHAKNFEEAGVENAWEVFSHLRGFIEQELTNTPEGMQLG